ncbi:ABC transporter [Klebsiella pneumoniae]|uniref:ABC transporter n=1 Tax=Klebsiella pneumoniae TaxID=573 RepID=A0A2X3EE36_KLEPN|nr:ABC transporter [Klebsiella pneumoniae]
MTRKLSPAGPTWWKPEYKSSLLLTDDAREVFQMALRKLGYSGNTTDPKEIEAAYNELKKLMPNVAAFNSDNPANPYMEGEVNLGMVWNGSAYVARQAGTPLEVIWPKEGGIFWMDSLSIPANAKNVDGALKLINFLLRPDVAKQVAETIGYPTPNLAARKMLSPAVANDKSLYPDAATIEKGEWQNDVGSASAIYEEYYQKLKAGRLIPQGGTAVPPFFFALTLAPQRAPEERRQFAPARPMVKIHQPLRHRFLPPVGDEPGRQGHQRQFAMPKTTRKRPKRRLNHRAIRFLQHKAVMHLAPPALNIVERVAGKRPPRARG